MKERITFSIQNPDSTYTDNMKMWAHVYKDGFTRSDSDNWFRFRVRNNKSLLSILAVDNRIIWKGKLFNIFSWEQPEYAENKMIEIMAKEVGTTDGANDSDFFKDFISVFSMIKTEVNEYGLVSYKYDYNFDTPSYTGVRCFFNYDRNRYLEDGTVDVEHDSLTVKFPIDAPIKVEDYIYSPIHGRFKIDMMVKNNENMLEVAVQRREVQ